MTFSFSFATLVKAKEARLHHKCILTKEREKIKTITTKFNVFKDPLSYLRNLRQFSNKI